MNTQVYQFTHGATHIPGIPGRSFSPGQRVTIDTDTMEILDITDPTISVTDSDPTQEEAAPAVEVLPEPTPQPLPDLVQQQAEVTPPQEGAQ